MKLSNVPWKNPVLIKEIRTRMRGNRPFIVLTIHLFLVGLVIGLIYVVVQSSISSGNSFEERRTFGKALFILLLGLELVMMSFIAPALTSGSISMERERQTLDLLRVTLLPAKDLVLGKYTSGIIFIFLLLFTAIPLYGPAFLAGGVLLEEILIGILILTVSALTFCAVGVFISSLSSRTLLSTVLAYSFAIFIVFGIPIIMLIALLALNFPSTNSIGLYPPITQAVLLFLAWLLISITPLATLIATEIFLLSQQSILWAKISLNSQVSITLISPWIAYAAIYILLSLFLLWLSIQIVNRSEK
jgi:ABC-type transport system involved in multi-copper enzyme maturation permease subunit